VSDHKYYKYNVNMSVITHILYDYA